jgi:hypothetical protein
MSRLQKLQQVLKNPIGNLIERNPLARLLMKDLPVFVVNSGNWAKFPNLTLRSANQFPAQLSILMRIHPAQEQGFNRDFPDTLQSQSLGSLFEQNGSDKKSHGYERIYSKLFENFQKHHEINLLEIGIGTNSHGLISSMGRNGKPGASLRTFAQFDDRLKVFGADVDKGILFSANRIRCCYIDQTNLETYFQLCTEFGVDKFDIIIDDGLHSTEANLNSLIFALDHLTPGGYLIIEDIPDRSISVWRLVVALLQQEGFEISFYRANRCNVIILRRSL